MSLPQQDLNNLLRYNAKIKKGKKAKRKPHWQPPVKPNPMKITPYRFVKTVEPTHTSQFQAPHHDELVDLTDDLAPEISAPNAANTIKPAGPAKPQPVATTSENKLNFKFQKTLPKKTPDWTKYQNNFKRISAASPDSEHGEQVDQKPVSTEAQKEIVDLTDPDKSEDIFPGLPTSVMEVVKEKLKVLPAGKRPIIMPSLKDPPMDEEQLKELKVAAEVTHNVTKPGDVKKSPISLRPIEQLKVAAEVTHKVTKPGDVKKPPISLRPIEQLKELKVATDVTRNVAKPGDVKKPISLRPIEVRFPRSQLNQGQERAMKKFSHSGGSDPYNLYDYPKGVAGIPRSFLKQQEQNKVNPPYQPASTPPLQNLVYDYPKGVAGIPRSFLIQQEQNKVDPSIQPASTPPLQNLVYDYPKGVAGIPRSFLKQQEQNKVDPPRQTASTPPSQNPGIPKSFFMRQENYKIDPHSQLSHTPPLQNAVPEYQLQSGLDLPSWILGSQHNPEPVEHSSIYDGLELETGPNSAAFGQHEPTPNRSYSPSDAYTETVGKAEEEAREGSESPDMLHPGQKRLSAFERLGPLTKPKKPKLTINLMFNKEQSVREVVDESTESFRFVPVHLRRDILESNDEIVKKYLPFWPWKKNLVTRKSVSFRHSKSVMILEQEQMEAGYEKDNMFIHVSVKGYPTSWTKEDVLDAILECVKGKSFIPCFIEFTPQECKFLVIRSRAALVVLHKVGFCVRAADAELTVTISLTETSLKQLDLIPRLILRRRMLANQNESSLDLSNFLGGTDVSHFVYFPLNRMTNQVELVQLHSAVAWEYLTELNLSKNRISNLDGFDLQSTTPKLRHLDLSHNLLDKVTILLKCRDLPLRSIKLEGNPLCLDYIDSAHYVKVVKMIFSGLREIDGVPLTFKGDLPPARRNFCLDGAAGVATKFLETYFPLLEAPIDDRAAVQRMYAEDAVMTVTFKYKLRYGSAFRYFRNLFVRSRNLEEGDTESIRGAPSIGDLIAKWPPIQHDRYTITVDVMYHDDSTTVLRLGGILKLTAETLAEDEHLLTFTRTVVLHTRNGVEYKIHNEMLYWDVPSEEHTQTAFNITTLRSKQLSLKLESPPDEELKSNLLNIFVRLADIDKKRGGRCLEKKNWDLRAALDYYVKLLKLDDLSSLNEPEKETTPLPQPS